MTLRKPTVIRDEIHGDITFDGLVEKAIDHECVQRLRFIKQLGLADFIFPCATHTRFQHSLGAAWLAGHYFDSLTRAWSDSPLKVDGQCGGTRFLEDRTRKCVEAVQGHPPSRELWRQVIRLGGLLHDVGHGPLSHTFENLDIQQDFSDVIGRLGGVLRKYFDSLLSSGQRLYHEDISLLYVFHLFHDLAARGAVEAPDLYTLAVAGLIHRKLVTGELATEFEKELERALAAKGMKGGTDFHRLLRPIISGPFDVDRMDYIQRDGRNCGVSIGMIEWRRIVTKLVPCLAEHPSLGQEPRDVVLVSSLKNQHVLDDFIFSLFQMYTQVYLHPKIVGVEEVIKDQLTMTRERQKGYRITFAEHVRLTDERLKDLFVREFGMSGVEKVLTRQQGTHFDVGSYPPELRLETQLLQAGYRRIEHLDRPMMKDSVGVFLYARLASHGRESIHMTPWVSVSPVAKYFLSVNYSPYFWIRS